MTRERIAKLPPDDWRQRNPNFQEALLSRNLHVAAVLAEVGKRQGRPAGEVAIAWVLHDPAVTAAIVGVGNPKQVQGIIGAAEFRLNQSEIEEIERALRELAVA
jgi:aryl-alcohol dehydrogenase-like predicted oxidoreductase